MRVKPGPFQSFIKTLINPCPMGKYWRWHNLNTQKMRLPIVTVAKINFYPSSSKPSVQQWRGTQGRTGHHAGADAVRQKLLYTNTNNPNNRHSEIVGPIPSTASVSRHPRPENIPSLLARLVGKKQETWPFLEPRILCVCVCILVINGGTFQHLFLFFSPSRRHMTHRQSFLAPVRHESWPPSFSGGPCSMWLRNGFRHFDAGKKKKKKQFIVFINSCYGHEPTHDLKEGVGGGALARIDQRSHVDKIEERLARDTRLAA